MKLYIVVNVKILVLSAFPTANVEIGNVSFKIVSVWFKYIPCKNDGTLSLPFQKCTYYFE